MVQVKNKCTHTRAVSGRWVDNPYHNPEEYELGGYDSGAYMWEEGYEESTTIDICTHSYKCTQCGEVMYYSSYGKDLLNAKNKEKDH